MIQPFRCEVPPPSPEFHGLAWLDALENAIEHTLQATYQTPVSLVRWAIVAINTETKHAAIEGAFWLKNQGST